MEHGIWQVMMEKYGREEYPTVCVAVKLAAFMGKAAFQVQGVTIHSLLSIGKIDMSYGIQLSQAESLRRLQRDLKNTRFLFLDEMSMIGLRLLDAIDNRL